MVFTFAIEAYCWLKPGQFINFLIFFGYCGNILTVSSGYAPVWLYRIFISGGLSSPKP